MNDTDSLLVFRLQRLRSQPKTVRGRCILFYASLDERPCARIALASAFFLFVLVHTMCFCFMIYYCFEDSVCSIPTSQILLPILLLSIYPLPLILVILYILVRDIIVKKEGIMVWHRNSLGILCQRFFFSLILFSSILTFMGCVDTTSSDELKKCMEHTCIPLILVLLIVTLKVFCLRQQRIFLWSGFIICLIAQMIVLKVVDTEFLVSGGTDLPTSRESDGESNMIQKCLVFLPCVTFGLAADIQIIASTLSYRPLAFTSMPCKCTRGLMLALGYISLLQTIWTYFLCFMVFGGLSDNPLYRKLVFASFIVKAVTWSPYLGFEFYDTLFEQIYYDVNFQINQIKPATSRSSPSQQDKTRRSTNKPALSAQLSFVQEQNDCSATGGNLSTANDQDMRGSLLFQPQNVNQQKLTAMKSASGIGGNERHSYLNDNHQNANNGNNAIDEPEFSQVKPVEFQTEQEIADMQNNRMVIQDEQQSLLQTITDNSGSMMVKNYRNMTLTECEKLIQRQAAGNDGSCLTQNIERSQIANDQQDSLTIGKFGGGAEVTEFTVPHLGTLSSDQLANFSGNQLSTWDHAQSSGREPSSLAQNNAFEGNTARIQTEKLVHQNKSDNNQISGFDQNSQPADVFQQSANQPEKNYNQATLSANLEESKQ